MFTRIVASAIFAGAAAGLIAGLLQLAFVQPVLLQAELYESGQLVHFGAAPPGEHSHDLGAAAPSAHSHDSAGAPPGDHVHDTAIAPVRDALTVVFTILTYAGYALILVAAMALAERRGARIDARAGLVWGIAGFVAAHFAPAFSLAPEVPGMAAADLGARQAWWFATVALTALAMWLLAFGRAWPAWAAAAALVLAPHLVGAPRPDAFTGPVPPELAALFAARALGVGAAAWLLLGCFAGHFWQREGQRAALAQRA